MKFTIKGNIITIKYINNGKLKTMKLDIKDKIDLDFFNRLQQADPNKQDSMCDMYQRNILKPNNKNTEHITPLILTKELERPTVVKQQELLQRKRELEQDKKIIEEEAKTLLKDNIKLKDLKEDEDLTDKVEYGVDQEHVKNIIQRYHEIERIETMVINELNSMEIKTANTVTISELKNLTVNAYENINKTIMETKLNSEDKQELADTIVSLIKPDIKQLKSSFGVTIGKVIKLLQSTPDINNLKNILSEFESKLLEELQKLPPNDNIVESVKEDLSEIQQKSDQKIIMEKLKSIS